MLSKKSWQNSIKHSMIIIAVTNEQHPISGIRLKGQTSLFTMQPLFLLSLKCFCCLEARNICHSTLKKSILWSKTTKGSDDLIDWSIKNLFLDYKHTCVDLKADCQNTYTTNLLLIFVNSWIMLKLRLIIWNINQIIQFISLSSIISTFISNIIRTFSWNCWSILLKMTIQGWYGY